MAWRSVTLARTVGGWLMEQLPGPTSEGSNEAVCTHSDKQQKNLRGALSRHRLYKCAFNSFALPHPPNKLVKLNWFSQAMPRASGGGGSEGSRPGNLRKCWKGSNRDGKTWPAGLHGTTPSCNGLQQYRCYPAEGACSMRDTWSPSTPAGSAVPQAVSQRSGIRRQLLGMSCRLPPPLHMAQVNNAPLCVAPISEPPLSTHVHHITRTHTRTHAGEQWLTPESEAETGEATQGWMDNVAM